MTLNSLRLVEIQIRLEMPAETGYLNRLKDFKNNGRDIEELRRMRMDTSVEIR